MTQSLTALLLFTTLLTASAQATADPSAKTSRVEVELKQGKQTLFAFRGVVARGACADVEEKRPDANYAIKICENDARPDEWSLDFGRSRHGPKGLSQTAKWRFVLPAGKRITGTVGTGQEAMRVDTKVQR